MSCSSIATDNAANGVGIMLPPKPPCLGSIWHLNGFDLPFPLTLKNQVIGGGQEYSEDALPLSTTKAEIHIPQMRESTEANGSADAKGKISVQLLKPQIEHTFDWNQVRNSTPIRTEETLMISEWRNNASRGMKSDSDVPSTERSRNVKRPARATNKAARDARVESTQQDQIASAE